MIERDTKGEFVRIRCDTCGEPAPSTPDRIINHGLIGLGWACSGGKHVCPAPTCQPDATPSIWAGFSRKVALYDNGDAKGRAGGWEGRPAE